VDAPCADGVCEDGICTLLEPGASCTASVGDFRDELGPCRVGTCRDGVCPAIVPLGSTCPAGDAASSQACDMNVDCHPSTGTCEPTDARYICP
jgi:hypothetical protein